VSRKQQLTELIKQPSAWLPVALSLAVFAVMLIFIATSGVPAPQPDEGTAAHLFQIWLLLEVLMISFFVFKWLPQKPRETLVVFAMQAGTMLLPMAIVHYLQL